MYADRGEVPEVYSKDSVAHAFYSKKKI